MRSFYIQWKYLRLISGVLLMEYYEQYSPPIYWSMISHITTTTATILPMTGPSNAHYYFTWLLAKYSQVKDSFHLICHRVSAIDSRRDLGISPCYLLEILSTVLYLIAFYQPSDEDSILRTVVVVGKIDRLSRMTTVHHLAIQAPSRERPSGGDFSLNFPSFKSSFLAS